VKSNGLPEVRELCERRDAPTVVDVNRDALSVKHRIDARMLAHLGARVMMVAI
jgi:hypothetical protein